MLTGICRWPGIICDVTDLAECPLQVELIVPAATLEANCTLLFWLLAGQIFDQQASLHDATYAVI